MHAGSAPSRPRERALAMLRFPPMATREPAAGGASAPAQAPGEGRRRRPAPAAAVAAVAVVLAGGASAAVSWQCWINPFIDSGRELDVAARLAAGERLYRDVDFYYGPL